MATRKAFAFPLGTTVMQRRSLRIGEVIARAHYLRRNPTYLVEFVGQHGNQVEDWFDEESLTTDGMKQPAGAQVEE